MPQSQSKIPVPMMSTNANIENLDNKYGSKEPLTSGSKIQTTAPVGQGNSQHPQVTNIINNNNINNFYIQPGSNGAKTAGTNS